MKKVNKKVKTEERLIKTILTFVCYFFYSQAFTSLFGSSITVSFLADIIFLVVIVLAYKDNLKADYKDLKKNYKPKDIIKVVLGWVLIIFIFNIIMGALTDLLVSSSKSTLDGNTSAMDTVFKASPFYGIFKTMIFAVIAEELLFRESVHDVIKNKWLFLIGSSMIYTLVNFVYTGFDDKFIVLSLLTYFLPALLFSYSYYKNNSNIIILMLIKFTYNIIPTLMYFLGF